MEMATEMAMEMAVKAVAMEEEAKRAAAAAGGVVQGAPAAPAGHKGFAVPNPLPP